LAAYSAGDFLVAYPSSFSDSAPDLRAAYLT
jgi:hypothetical protein